MKKIVIIGCLAIFLGGITATTAFHPSQTTYITADDDPAGCHKTDTASATSDTTKKACCAHHGAKCEKKCPHKHENKQE